MRAICLTEISVHKSVRYKVLKDQSTWPSAREQQADNLQEGGSIPSPGSNLCEVTVKAVVPLRDMRR